MEILVNPLVEGERLLPERASTDRVLIQKAYKASLSQQVAALEKIAEELTCTQTTPSPPAQHLPNFLEDEDPAYFFTTFEQIAQQTGWPKSKWAHCIAPHLPGKQQVAYPVANPLGTTPYAEVKQALLEMWELDAEHYRLRLRKEQLQDEETPQALYNRIQAQLNGWLQPTQNTKEQMLDLLCLEQFVSGLPTPMQTWVKQHPGLTIQEAVCRATAFQRDRTPPHSSSRNGNRELSMPEPPLKTHHNVKTPETKEPRVKRWRALWPSNSEERTVQGYDEYGGSGHISGACPKRQTNGGIQTEDSGHVLSSVVSPFIKTFIFLDLETTGLPRHRPKVTELCLVAVHRTALENPVWDTTTSLPPLPRIVDKLCLIVDPGKLVTPIAAKITGLNNSNLAENEKPNFDECTIALIQEFLQRQVQPVCLVAHNGYGFDFPLLKTELQLQGKELSGLVYCLDTMQALKGLYQHPGANPTDAPASYSLSSLYNYFFQKKPKASHHAEGDVLTMLLVFLGKARELLEYAETHTKAWAEVQPMYTPCVPQIPLR